MTVTVTVAGKEYQVAGDIPFLFGRADDTGVVGLDPSDMGISAVSGSVERLSDLWWVVNRSRSRPLLLEAVARGNAITLECGQRYAISTARLVILVPGANITHRIEIRVPVWQLARVSPAHPATGTVGPGQVSLSDRDREVLVALLGGYLEGFPRRNPRPRTYREASDLLGPPWTPVRVRKQVERLKERLARADRYFEGPQANYDLADFLISEDLLGPHDLERFRNSEKDPGTD